MYRKSNSALTDDDDTMDNSTTINNTSKNFMMETGSENTAYYPSLDKNTVLVSERASR